MKMQEALKIIAGPARGYMVSFERREDGVLFSDHFPDVRAGETPISTEEQAWDLAIAFASKTFGVCVNIYVIDGNFKPVPGYMARRIVNREINW